MSENDKSQKKPNDALPYTKNVPVAKAENPYIENKNLLDESLDMTPQERQHQQMAYFLQQQQQQQQMQQMQQQQQMQMQMQMQQGSYNQIPPMQNYQQQPYMGQPGYYGGQQGAMGCNGHHPPPPPPCDHGHMGGVMQNHPVQYESANSYYGRSSSYGDHHGGGHYNWGHHGGRHHPECHCALI